MKKLTVFILPAIIWLNIHQIHAQNRHYQPEIWLGYISSIKLTDHFAIWNDVHWVPNSFFINRHGLTWIHNKHFDVTVGYANVLTTTSFSQSLIRHEHRPWGQIVGRIGLNKHFSLRSRFRYDARFRKRTDQETVHNNYIFYNRLRLFNNIRYSFIKNGKPSWHVDLMHEYLFNLGKQINNGTDQNRIFLLAGRHIHGLNIMAGLHLRMIPQTNAPVLIRNGVTIWIVHNIHRKCVAPGCVAD